jgi:hypothetical protein
LYRLFAVATPHVAGVAALLMSFKPSASAADILEAMIGSAEDLGFSGHDSSYGHGLVQALAATEYLNGGALDGNGRDDGISPDPPQTSPPVDEGENACPSGTKPFQLRLNTDRYGSETSWILRRIDNAASLSDSNLVGNEEYVVDRCLSGTCYSFTISDSYGDGVS